MRQTGVLATRMTKPTPPASSAALEKRTIMLTVTEHDEEGAEGNDECIVCGRIVGRPHYDTSEGNVVCKSCALENSNSSDTTALKALQAKMAEQQTEDEGFMESFEQSLGPDASPDDLEQAASKDYGYIRADTRITFIKELLKLIADSSAPAGAKE
jgi:hypothetical protein